MHLILTTLHKKQQKSDSDGCVNHISVQVLLFRVRAQKLRYTRVRTEHKSENTEAHDCYVLPQKPIPMALVIRPKRDHLDKWWKDQRQSRAAYSTNERNYRFKFWDNGRKKNCEEIFIF